MIANKTTIAKVGTTLKLNQNYEQNQSESSNLDEIGDGMNEVSSRKNNHGLKKAK